MTSGDVLKWSIEHSDARQVQFLRENIAVSMHLAQDLTLARREILRMGDLVRHVVHASLDQLERATSTAEEIPVEEREIDKIDVQLETACLRMLALYQPVAGDLRQIAAMLKIGSELERIADLGQNITERAIALHGLPAIAIPTKLVTMADEATEMVDQSLKAYTTQDIDLAKRICDRDEFVDQLNREVIEELSATMQNSPSLVASALQLFSVSRHIERIGDHATNIAEDVIYLVDGRIVRHRQVWSGRQSA